jgi:hypothetical protein
VIEASRLYSTSIILLILPLSGIPAPIDNAHFYRPTYFWGEPRFEKKHLTSFDLSIAGGTSNTGQDSCGHCVELFDIYGFGNMRALGKGVKEINPEISKILDDIEHIHSNRCFGVLSIGAEFKIIEAYLNLYQNLSRGFFLQVNLPIRSFEVKNVCKTFIPPKCDPISTQCPAAWQTFLDNFDAILTTYNLTIEPFDKAHTGSLGFMLGLTSNYEGTTYLDFIDTTFKLGLLIPTGRKNNPHHVLEISHDYDGHVGFPFYWTSAIGLFDWITWGLHAFLMPFTNRVQTIHIKTSPDQEGILKLASTQANVSLGPLWEIGAYFKADHVVSDFSIILAYTFDKKQADELHPLHTSTVSTVLMNDDITLNGWRMHTLNLILEWDFNASDRKFGPRVAFLYNKVLGGKRIFNGKMIGGNFGFDVTWNY